MSNRFIYILQVFLLLFTTPLSFAEYSLYENGLLSYSTRDDLTSEESVHFPLLLNKWLRRGPRILPCARLYLHSLPSKSALAVSCAILGQLDLVVGLALHSSVLLGNIKS